MEMLIGLSIHFVLKARKRCTYNMGLFIGLSVQLVLEDINRYTYTMGLFMGLIRANIFP